MMRKAFMTPTIPEKPKVKKRNDLEKPIPKKKEDKTDVPTTPHMVIPNLMRNIF
jgi:hypothetical protein